LITVPQGLQTRFRRSRCRVWLHAQFHSRDVPTGADLVKAELGVAARRLYNLIRRYAKRYGRGRNMTNFAKRSLEFERASRHGRCFAAGIELNSANSAFALAKLVNGYTDMLDRRGNGLVRQYDYRCGT